MRGVAREAAGGPTIAGVNSQRVEVSNLYYDDAEAFGALGDDYAPAERTVVVFANDSMRLGPDGKRQIARFVEDYREGEDLIGLIGCSNGPTALDIGNEGLALGRSRRVSEELVRARRRPPNASSTRAAGRRRARGTASRAAGSSWNS